MILITPKADIDPVPKKQDDFQVFYFTFYIIRQLAGVLLDCAGGLFSISILVLQTK